MCKDGVHPEDTKGPSSDNDATFVLPRLGPRDASSLYQLCEEAQELMPAMFDEERDGCLVLLQLLRVRDWGK